MVLYHSSLFPFLILGVQSDSGWQVNFVSVKLRVFPFGKVLISPLLRPTQLKMASPLYSSHAGNVHGIQFDRSHLFGEDGYTSVLHGTLNGQRVAIKRIEVTRGTNQTTDNKYYAFEWCNTSISQLFLKSDDPKKYDGPMPHHIDALFQLASGLKHIHSQNLVHGNIKPENVLISVRSGGKDDITLKWANFGLTRNVSERGRGKQIKWGR
ncbi:hypothetical protein OUZ56_020266 [Daphnia magna]|uniref:Protein kinase domain-containing protein n=1 Tax=Daphnia magna TaxID=35525 RepID=A0ABQ9ZE08_9CRUS|nr:hypothetical protein OUZ56_020266 [Daphnia magna]